MKCPKCSASFSDLRDICPQCLLDLRSEKISKGIKVTYQAASYEALLRKLNKESPAEKTGSSAPSSHPKPKDPSVENPSIENQAGSHSFILSDNPDNPQDLVESTLNQMLETEFHRQSEKHLFGTGGLEYPDISASYSVELATKEEPTSPQFLEAKVDNTQPVKIDLDELFSEAYANLDTHQSELEIPLYQLNPAKNDDVIAVLFHLAQESIDDPSKDISSIGSLSIDRNTGMEILALQKSQERTIFIPPSASVAPLKIKSGAQLSMFRDTDAQKIHTAIQEPVLSPPAASIRLWAFSIDLLCACFLAVIFGLAISLVRVQDSDRFLIDLISLNSLGLVQLLRGFVPGFLMAFVLYPILMLTLFSSTIGLHNCKIGITCENRRPLKFANIFVRTCTFPIFLLTGGPFWALKGERCLHDKLARVMLHKRQLD